MSFWFWRVFVLLSRFNLFELGFQGGFRFLSFVPVSVQVRLSGWSQCGRDSRRCLECVVDLSRLYIPFTFSAIGVSLPIGLYRVRIVVDVRKGLAFADTTHRCAVLSRHLLSLFPLSCFLNQVWLSRAFFARLPFGLTTT